MCTPIHGSYRRCIWLTDFEFANGKSGGQPLEHRSVAPCFQPADLSGGWPFQGRASRSLLNMWVHPVAVDMGRGKLAKIEVVKGTGRGGNSPAWAMGDPTDLAQGMRPSHLAKQHGDELAPTGETSRLSFCRSALCCLTAFSNPRGKTTSTPARKCCILSLG